MSCSLVSSTFIGVLLCQRNYLLLSIFGRLCRNFPFFSYCYLPRCDVFNCVVNIFLVHLSLLQEFYGDKKNPYLGMLEDLPDTFEHWAEMIRVKLLSYQRQTDEYYNFCLRGKFIQLRLAFFLCM